MKRIVFIVSLLKNNLVNKNIQQKSEKTMSRKILSSDQISPSALGSIKSYHADVVQKVETAVKNHKVVVIGMNHNPYVKKVRNALSDAKIPFEYYEFGNYFSQWKQRLAIKLWSGWPTFPQVFVSGKLVGGYQETNIALKNGEFKA